MIVAYPSEEAMLWNKEVAYCLVFSVIQQRHFALQLSLFAQLPRLSVSYSNIHSL